MVGGPFAGPKCLVTGMVYCLLKKTRGGFLSHGGFP